MQLVDPKVFLIAETTLTKGHKEFLDFLNVPEWTTDAVSEAETLIETAGKLCYMSFSTDLNANLTRVGGRNNFDYIQQGLIGTGHGSVIEHATVTFAIMNVSRVVTHELVRHRAGAAYSQLSGRYVRLNEISMAQWPDCISKDAYAEALMNEAVLSTESIIKQLADHYDLDNTTNFALKKEVTSALRRIIGNGQSNHIIATLNHRAIRHIIGMRSSAHAEEEIRRVAEQMWDLVSTKFPAIYADGVVEMINGIKQITFIHGSV